MCRVICITNKALCGDFFSQLERVAAARPDRIILREKDLTESEYTELAKKAKGICERYGVALTLHSFVNAARALGVKSIHLPLPVLEGLDDSEIKWFDEVGVSCHSAHDAEYAKKRGAAYITLGHIYDTDCKRGLPGRGVRFLSEVCKAVSLPIYAIGGIDAVRAGAVSAAGASGICVMSSIMKAPDPKKYISEIRKACSMRFDKSSLLLYAITDEGALAGRDLYKSVESALKGGATMIQLRDKGASQQELTDKARALTALCHRYSVPLIVNDNCKAALDAGADGVHVGIEDTPVSEIRRLAGEGFIIGATAKTIEQAKAAKAQGADYLGVGAVFPSPTKANAIRITADMFTAIKQSTDLPAVAIGGINKDNILTLKDHGADGAAVVSAVFAAEDIEAAASQLKELAEQIVK